MADLAASIGEEGYRDSEGISIPNHEPYGPQHERGIVVDPNRVERCLETIATESYEVAHASGGERARRS